MEKICKYILFCDKGSAIWISGWDLQYYQLSKSWSCKDDKLSFLSQELHQENLFLSYRWHLQPQSLEWLWDGF